jgi:hypothetical protein
MKTGRENSAIPKIEILPLEYGYDMSYGTIQHLPDRTPIRGLRPAGEITNL